LAATGALALGGCVSTEYVGEQIKASEQRQAAVDEAQSNQITQMDRRLADSLDRANKALEMRQSASSLTSAASSLIIRFDRNSSQISPDERTRLAELAISLLQTGEEFYLEIQGHTDSSGSPRANVEVGAKRAETVRLFLHEKGIPLRRMSTISFGDTMPLIEGDDQGTQTGNRRVEIIAFK
jgi:outer membrane protein OmpA-like peptidoglycan-associated protein